MPWSALLSLFLWFPHFNILWALNILGTNVYLVRSKYLRRWCVGYTTCPWMCYAWLVIRNKYLLVLADSKSFPSQGNDSWYWFKETIWSWRNDTLELLDSYSTVCTRSLLLLLTGVQEYLTLYITIDTYFVFACNKIKTVLSIEHTYGITSHCKSTTHSDEQWKNHKKPNHLI